MIKKIVLMTLLVLFISGCGMALDIEEKEEATGTSDTTATSTIKNNEAEVQLPVETEDSSSHIFSNEYRTILMENVESSDILLHEKIAFTQIKFSVRDNTSLSAGKDIYSIAYLSSAEPEVIYDAYREYIDKVTDEFANEYSLDIEGTVKGLPISVSVELNQLIDIKGYPVRITISEDPAKFQDENRYFNEYPDLVEFYQLKKDALFHSESTYLESYLDGTKTYLTSFATSAGNDDFTKFYTDNYSQNINFAIEEDEYQKKITWSDSGFDHKILFQKSNNGASVYVETSLP